MGGTCGGTQAASPLVSDPAHSLSISFSLIRALLCYLDFRSFPSLTRFHCVHAIMLELIFSRNLSHIHAHFLHTFVHRERKGLKTYNKPTIALGRTHIDTHSWLKTPQNNTHTHTQTLHTQQWYMYHKKQTDST